MEVKFEEKVIAQTPYFTEFENKIYFPLDSIVSKYVKVCFFLFILENDQNISNGTRKNHFL